MTSEDQMGALCFWQQTPRGAQKRRRKIGMVDSSIPFAEARAQLVSKYVQATIRISQRSTETKRSQHRSINHTHQASIASSASSSQREGIEPLAGHHPVRRV